MFFDIELVVFAHELLLVFLEVLSLGVRVHWTPVALSTY